MKFLRTIAGISIAVVAAQAQTPTDYKPLHNLLIKFYGFQRAGDKTVNVKNPFYTRTGEAPHSRDASGSIDLSGGWYDAGDFVKFGLPFGYATYCLLKGYDVFPRGYDDADSWDYKGTADQIPDILGEVKLATDYMIKAVISSSQVVTDVGNGDQDHQAMTEDGYANSQRTSPRTATVQTGADIAGLNAAALALMSIVYKPHDATYAAKCLAKAKEAYTFGKANQKFSTQQNNGQFYKTAKWEDKMACAAIELYRATNEATYLADAKAFLAKVGQHYFVLGYNYVGDLAYFEVKRQTGESVEGPWMSDVAFYMNRKVTAASAPALIKGAFINSDWGNAGHAGAAALSAGLAFTITGDNRYLDFARSQVHWVAGLAPSTQSFVVGFGNGPTAPHHRNDNTIGRSSGPRLKGGVVSGPTPTGTFDPSNPTSTQWSFTGNDVNNYKNTEVALDYNAGMVGAVAFLRDYDNPPAGLIRINTALTVTPGNVDLNVGPATITATLAASGAYKIVLTGKTSKAVKTYTGTGSAISLTWKGETDATAFMVGEQVDVAFDMPNIASYHQMRAKTSFFITGMAKEEFKATDIVFDDFEDGDVNNKVGGVWSIFTDKAQGGASSTNPATMATSILANEGEGLTKGLSIRLIGSAGAQRPMAGVRTTFNAAGTPVSLGRSTSVIFDIKASAGNVLWLELEQPGVTDSAYHAHKIQFGSASWMRLRIPFSGLTQPDWKTSAKPLNTGSAVSLRFTLYGETNVRFNLDNMRIENLDIGGTSILQAKNGRLLRRQPSTFFSGSQPLRIDARQGIWAQPGEVPARLIQVGK
jgi:endoglucanase